MLKSDAKLYKFGEFELDTIKRVLLHGQTPVRLPSKAFDVLLALVEHNQCIVTKDELMRLVWGERVVEENNLTRHISTLRKVLAESPNDHTYIVTVPGQGYSFVAPVEDVWINGAKSVAASQPGSAAVLQLETTAALQQNGFNRAAPFTSFAPAETVALRRAPFSLATLKRDRLLWVTALVVVLAGVGLFSFKLGHTRSARAGVNSYRDWEIVRLTRTGGSIAPDISPDGKYVAYVNNDVGQRSIWLLQLATASHLQLVAPEQFVYDGLRFSKDGSELYFTRRAEGSPVRSLYRISVIGGVAKKLRDDLYSPVELSPDGAHLAFARRNSAGKTEFIGANAEGVEQRVLLGHNLEFPAWSPDGKTLAFSVGSASGGGEGMSIREVRLNDGVKQELSPRKWTFVGHKVWLPDGSGLIVSARQQKASVNQLWLVAYPSGEARPLSNDLDSFSFLRLTADAHMLVTQQISLACDIWGGPLADAAEAKKIGVWGEEGLAFVNGARIVYSSLQSGETNKIWLMNADGSERKQLTFESSNDINPVASPDGRYIVFTSNRSGNFEIWRMNADGSNLVQLTRSKGANPPNISPDGKWVIYLSTSDGKLRKVPIEGGAAAELFAGAVGIAAVSPDGMLIAYFAQGKSAWEIAVNSLADGSLVKRFDLSAQALNNRALKWTPDSKALLYAANTAGVSNIWRQPLVGGAPQQVTNFKADGIFRFDVSSDGQQLICARGGWKHDIVLIKHLR